MKNEYLEILVNKENPLDINFIPDDIINVDNPYYSSFVPGYPLRVVKEVYENFSLLSNEAKAKGIELWIDSGYRDASYQQYVLDEYVKLMGEEAYQKVALPGTSEHQTGLAIDCGIFTNGEYKEELTDDMEETKWLHNNCSKYGFILRYPKDRESITGYSYEPWHLRYVGKELATKLTSENKTLEDYYREKDLSRK